MSLGTQTIKMRKHHSGLPEGGCDVTSYPMHLPLTHPGHDGLDPQTLSQSKRLFLKLHWSSILLQQWEKEVKQTYVSTHLCEFSRPCGLCERHARKPLPFFWSNVKEVTTRRIAWNIPAASEDTWVKPLMTTRDYSTASHQGLIHSCTQKSSSSPELKNKRCHDLCVAIHKVPSRTCSS